MPYEPRTIALLCELLHGPLPQDPRPVQQIHNGMFQGQDQPPYSSFAVSPVGPVLSNPDQTPGRISQVMFLPDQVQFREEMGHMTHETFASRVSDVAEQYAQSRGIENYTGQRITVRSLVVPHHPKDARAFLDKALFTTQGPEGNPHSRVMESFGGPAALYGLRLAFEDPGEPRTSIGLRIESYAQDARSLFIELQATSPALELHQSNDQLGQRVHDLYGFLEERTLPFIQSFDQAPNL